MHARTAMNPICMYDCAIYDSFRHRNLPMLAYTQYASIRLGLSIAVRRGRQPQIDLRFVCRGCDALATGGCFGAPWPWGVG